MKCETCRYCEIKKWMGHTYQDVMLKNQDPNYEMPEESEQARYTCKRFPPAWRKMQHSMGDFVYPIMGPNDWCGEYKEVKDG